MLIGLQFLLKGQVVDGRRHIEGLAGVAFHVVSHGAGLADNQKLFAGRRRIAAHRIAGLGQGFLDDADLVGNGFAKGFGGQCPHDFLVPKEGVGTIVHQFGPAIGGLVREGQPRERPPHNVGQAQAGQIGQGKARCLLEDMDTGVGAPVCRADLRHICHLSYAKTVQYNHHKLAHRIKLPFLVP